MPPRKTGGGKSAASAPPRVVPAKIEIPLLSKPVYVPGAGPRSAPISLTPEKDSTAYILDKYVLPKLSECGPKDRRLVYYLVGFRDLPVVRILVPCNKAQEYVDPATIEQWEIEQHNKLMDERQRLKEEEAAKKRKRAGRPPKLADVPAERDYSKPSPHGTVATATPTDPEHHGLMLDTQLTGPSLSTPQKRPRPSLDQLDQLDRPEQQEAGPTKLNTKSHTKSNAKTQTKAQTTTSTSTASSFVSSSNINRPSVREEEANRRQLFYAATKHRLSPSYSPSLNQDPQDLAVESATMPRSGHPYQKPAANEGHRRAIANMSRASSSSRASTSAGQPVPSVSSSGGRQTRSTTRNSRPSTSGSASVDSPSGGAGTGTPQIHPDWAQIMKFSNKVMDVMDTLAPQYNIQPANAAATASGPTANTNDHGTTHPALTTSWGGDRLPLPNIQGIAPAIPTAQVAPQPTRSQKGKKRSPKDSTDEDGQAKKKRKTSKPKPKKEPKKEPKDEESSEGESWSVKRLLSDETRYEDGRRILYYLVEWVGDYTPTWEPASNILDKELVRVYKAQKKAGTLPPQPTAYSGVSEAFRGDINDDQNGRELVREDEEEEEEEDEILRVTEPATTPLPGSGKKREA